jgi:hypothetical protein
MYEEVKGRPSFVVESILNPPPGTKAPASARLRRLAGPAPSSPDPADVAEPEPQPPQRS